jgi:hypothetical protein
MVDQDVGISIGVGGVKVKVFTCHVSKPLLLGAFCALEFVAINVVAQMKSTSFFMIFLFFKLFIMVQARLVGVTIGNLT